MAIVKDRDVIYRNGVGLANLEHGIPITTATVFDLASVAKSFTGMAVATLAEEGKLDVTDDVRLYLPDVPDFGTTITVDNLIHHTSGIRDWVATLTISGRTESDVITARHIWTLIRNQRELNFTPGDKFNYSNTNYFLLAALIAKVTGMPFTDYVEKTILRPLGMHSTYIIDDHRSLVPNRATPYDQNDNGGYAAYPSNLSSVGSSSVLSSVDDMGKWLVNFESLEVGSRDILQRTERNAVLNSGDEHPYAYGLYTGEFHGRAYVKHGGWWQGYRSIFVRFPEEGLSIVVLANCIKTSPEWLADRIAMILLGIEEEGATAQPEQTLPEEIPADGAELDKYVGKYILGATAFTVAREDDRLPIRCTGFPLNTTIPVGKDTFFTVPEHEFIRFEADGSGAIAHLVVKHPDGSESPPFPRTEIITLADGKGQFCGRYYSQELDTLYTFRVEDDQLIASHFHNEDVILTQETSDVFWGDQWWFKRVIFTRDEDKQITGFRLDADNWVLEGLFFEKVVSGLGAVDN